MIFESESFWGSSTVLDWDAGVARVLIDVSTLAMLAYDREAMAGRKRDLDEANNREGDRSAAIIKTVPVYAQGDAGWRVCGITLRVAEVGVKIELKRAKRGSSLTLVSCITKSSTHYVSRPRPISDDAK